MSDSLKLPGDPSLPPGCSVKDIEERFGDPELRTCPRCHGDRKEPREERYYDLVLRWRRIHAERMDGQYPLEPTMLSLAADELETALKSKDEPCHECGGTGEVVSEGKDE